MNKVLDFIGLPVFLFMLMSNILIAQVSIDKNDFGNPGDSFLVAIDTQVNKSVLLSPGSGRNWDISSLDANNWTYARYLDPSTTSFSGTFPTSTVAVDNNTGGLVFNTVSDTNLTFDGTGIDQFGIQIPTLNNPPDVMLEFPAMIGQKLQTGTSSSNKMYVGQTIQGVPVDSIKVTTAITSTREIDADGTIKTRWGTFDCIRQYSVESTRLIVSTYAIIIGNFGLWVPVIDSVIALKHYTWYAKGGGYPMAEAFVDDAGNITEFQFQIGSSANNCSIELAGNVTVEPCTDKGASITVTASGGVPPYEFIWNNGATTSTIEDLNNGRYELAVTDNAGCFATKAFAVTGVSSALTLDSVVVDDETKNGSDGSVYIYVSGGTKPYSYTWSNGATTDTLGELKGGTYGVTLTDNAGCMLVKNNIQVGSDYTGPIFPGITFYPNPVENRFTVYIPDDVLKLNLIISLHTINGAVLMEERISSRHSNYDLSYLPSAVYIMQVISPISRNTLASEKVIISHSE